jgi:hypothetical protein
MVTLFGKSHHEGALVLSRLTYTVLSEVDGIVQRAVVSHLA